MKQEYSTEVEEIMGRIPGRINRIGIIFVFIIICLILGLTYFIKYPETISAPITITTANPPIDLIAKASGRIECLLVKDKDYVSTDQIVAVIHNAASYEDVLKIERLLKIDQDICTAQYQLGELQSLYALFEKIYTAYHYYLNASNVIPKKNLLKNQLLIQHNILLDQKSQLSLTKKDLNIEIERFHRDSLLYATQVFSLQDVEKSQQALIQKKLLVKNYELSIHSTQNLILSLQDQIADIDFHAETEINDYEMQLKEAKTNFLAKIDIWKNQYLITSPNDGKIAFTKYWSPNQNIAIGDRLATIIPMDTMQVIGKVVIPSVGFAKVRVGQKINVKLNAYPYTEYGILGGVIEKISAIPDQEGYVADVIFPKGMLSSYNIEFNSAQRMDGTAEIVTKDLRIIERFIQPFRSLFINH